MTFDLWTGEMKELYDKAGHWDVLGGRPGNIVAREQDGGDFWELYGTLNGGRLTAMTRKQGLPPSAKDALQQRAGGRQRVHDLRARCTPNSAFPIPLATEDFATTVRVYPGMRRIDIHTRLVNNDKFVRYRVLFPTSIENGRRFDEIPFGAIERPLEQEYPRAVLDGLQRRKQGAGAAESRPAGQQRGGRHADAFAAALGANLPLTRSSAGTSPASLRTWAWSWASRGRLTTPLFPMPATGARPRCTRRDGSSIIPFWRAK